MTKLAVLGSPIEHSMSPVIHQAAYAELGLDWQYERFECEAHELEDFLVARDAEWIGFSCTMPLKEQAYALADRHDPLAHESEVVNTLVRDGGGWYGANTDVGGLKMALEDRSLNLSNVVILGAGATAVSAILAAREGGAQQIEVRARREEAARSLADRFGVSSGRLGDADGCEPTTVISTLPGEAGVALQVPETYTRAALFDVAYNPWPSPLTKYWAEHGGEAYPGIDMLIYQAILQIRLFVEHDIHAVLEGEHLVAQAMRQAAASSMGE